MAWYDRLTLGVLMVLCVALVGALMTLGNHVADLDDRPVPTTIVESPPTTPPTFDLDGNRVVDDRCPNRLFMECT